MKILFVVTRPLEINTSASIRNKATILGMIENGHTVEIITTQPNLLHDNYDENLGIENIKKYYIKLNNAQKILNITSNLKFLKYFKTKVYKFKQRSEIYDSFKNTINLVDTLPLENKEYDCIISSSDPKSSHLLAEMIIEKFPHLKGVRWIQIWGDPFAKDITNKNKKINEITKEEHRLLSKATKIVYVSKMTLQEQSIIYKKYADKMFYIPIPYLEKKEGYNFINKDSYEIAYCGDYNSKFRNILPLYKAVNNNSNYNLTICGGTDIKLESTNNVTVLGRVSSLEVYRIEQKADILVHLSNSKGNQIPGKIYQYSGTDKPILFILDGEEDSIKKEFEKYDRYIFSKNSIKQIEEKLSDIIKTKHAYKPIEHFNKNLISRMILD